MEQMTAKLTVTFEEPFWIGIYEREADGKYEVCKITFGAEPKDYEVFEFLLINWKSLRFSKSMEVEHIAEKRINPKRMQREIKNQLQNNGIGTKAQQALKLQHEQGKLERKKSSREQKEAEKERQFELRQEKRKEKHKGH
ncbi:MAG: YjdF family protein [Anaerotignum sp.]|nr:YjdF family protein [Anaerotignum sp.]